ncbi:hypothetical protein MKX01_033567 [Papaver californicum]|nr:hypothetical protein MKX01_033567 [Papaver californicum]
MPSELFLRFRKEVEGIRVGLNLEFYKASSNEYQEKFVIKSLSPAGRWKFMYEPLHHDLAFLGNFLRHQLVTLISREYLKEMYVLKLNNPCSLESDFFELILKFYTKNKNKSSLFSLFFIQPKNLGMTYFTVNSVGDKQKENQRGKHEVKGIYLQGNNQYLMAYQFNIYF